MKILFLAFVMVPIAEMAVLIKVGSIIGALNTIGFVVLTAFIGAAMLRRQGLNTLLRANRKLSSGELPAQEVAEGFLLALGGALLLTPGFITDAFGFFLLIPVTRKALVQKVVDRMLVFNNQTMGQTEFYGTYQQYRRDQGDTIIEGEFYREDRRSASGNDRISNDPTDKKN